MVKSKLLSPEQPPETPEQADADPVQRLLQKSEDLRKKGQFGPALAVLCQAVRLDPQNVQALGKRGVMYRTVQQYARSLDDLNQAIRLDPNNTWLYGNRAETFRANREYREAVADYDRVLRLNPQAAWVYERRGYPHLWLGDLAAAGADFERATAANPENSMTGWMVEWVRMCQKPFSLTPAVQARLEKLAALDPDHYAAYLSRGFLLFARNEYADAWAEFDAACLLVPNQPAGYFWKGLAAQRLGHTEEAGELTQTALELKLPPVLTRPLFEPEPDKPILPQKPGPSNESNQDKEIKPTPKPDEPDQPTEPAKPTGLANQSSEFNEIEAILHEKPKRYRPVLLSAIIITFMLATGLVSFLLANPFSEKSPATVRIPGITGLLTPVAATLTQKPGTSSIVPVPVTPTPNTGQEAGPTANPTVNFIPTATPVFSNTSPNVPTKPASGNIPAGPGIFALLNIQSITGHTGKVTSAAWSGDGKYYATGSEDQTIKVWETATGRMVTTLALKDKNPAVYPVALRWNSDGKNLVSGWADKTTRLFDVFPADPGGPVGQVLAEIPGEVAPQAVAIAGSGTLLTYPGNDTLHTYDLAKHAKGPDFLLGAATPVTSAAFSPNDKFLAAGLGDGRVLVWEKATLKLILTIQPEKPGDANPVTVIAWSADNQEVVAGSQKNLALYQVDLTGGGKVKSTVVSQASDAPVTALKLTSDGKILAIGYQDGTLQVWSVVQNRPVAQVGSKPGAGAILEINFADGSRQIGVIQASEPPTLTAYSVPAQ